MAVLLAASEMVHSSTKGYTFELLGCDVIAGESSLLYRPVLLAAIAIVSLVSNNDDVHTFFVFLSLG